MDPYIRLTVRLPWDVAVAAQLCTVDMDMMPVGPRLTKGGWCGLLIAKWCLLIDCYCAVLGGHADGSCHFSKEIWNPLFLAAQRHPCTGKCAKWTKDAKGVWTATRNLPNYHALDCLIWSSSPVGDSKASMKLHSNPDCSHTLTHTVTRARLQGASLFNAAAVAKEWRDVHLKGKDSAFFSDCTDPKQLSKF